MPIDLAIVRKLNKGEETPGTIINTGNGNFIWESFENDIQIDALNQIVVVEGTTKLAQSIMKIILTPKGSLPDDPEYGTDLNLSVGSKFNSETFADVQTEITDALIHYNLINADNPDSDEVIEVIDEIKVVQDLDDPRAMKIVVSVTTEAGNPVRVTVPQII